MRIFGAVLLLLVSISYTDAAYPIPGTFTGYGPAPNQRPARQNIVNLQRNRYQWPLYIQALREMQAAPQTDLLSYYQIAGIHGRPYDPWDNALNPAGGNFGPYCTHNSPLFGSWHRPYLALYEQVLARRVQSIAQRYRGRGDEASWLDAANRFRIPYWDWAESQSIPNFLQTSTIAIEFPTGTFSIDNPLYDYNFNPPVNAAEAGPASWTTTRRGATNLINAALTAWGVKTLTYNTFLNRNYISYIQQSNGGSNIESVHGSVHVAAVQGAPGGIGNMQFVEWSAFDPIFMLHHCNVDRLVAMWQVLNPASYIPSTGTPNNYASFALPAGTVYPNTPLRPFLRTTNQWWDSNLARFPANMGYTYPEINDWSLNQAQSQANVRAAIIARYGPGAPLPRRQENGTEVEGPRKSWYATVSCRTNIAEKSFYVCLFFGEPPKDPKEWLSSEYLVNMMPVLVPDTTQVKTGTKRPDYMRTNMEYPLDDKLLQNDIYPLTPENVEPYLAEKLTWRIMTSDYEEIPVEDDDRLEIGVYDVDVAPPADPKTEFPTYGEKTDHPEATKGKTGSVNEK